MARSKSYYDIAKEDWWFLQMLPAYSDYNRHTVMCQQICEKLLKSVAEVLIHEDKYRRQHKLYKICDAINKEYPNTIKLDEVLSFRLSDFYIDARYPGEDYIDIDKETYIKYLNFTKEVITKVDTWRAGQGLPVYDVTYTESKSLVDVASGIK